MKMKCIVYGGEVGIENDMVWSKCFKIRREVIGEVRVIIFILGS